MSEFENKFGLRIRFGKKRLYSCLGFYVSTFADMRIANAAFLVDQVKSRPVAVIVSRPSFPVIILCHGIRDIETLDRSFEIIQICFMAELGVVVPDNH